MDALAVDDDVVAVGRHLARELAVDAVVLEQPGIGLGVGEIVDADQLEPAVGPLEDRPGDQPADTAEAVDCNSRHAISLCFMTFEDASGDLIGREAEKFVGVLGRRRDAEAVDADAEAVEAGVAFPAEGRPGLDRDAQESAVGDVGQDVVAIIPRLRVEALGARHGDDIGADPPRFKLLGRVKRDLDLRTGRDQDHLARAFSAGLSR